MVFVARLTSETNLCICARMMIILAPKYIFQIAAVSNCIHGICIEDDRSAATKYFREQRKVRGEILITLVINM